MPFFDTHCHLQIFVKSRIETLITSEQMNDIAAVVEEAHTAKVETLLTVGTTYHESVESVKIAQAYDNVYATVGLHPTDATDSWQEELRAIKREFFSKSTNAHVNKKIVGIGECGFDMFHGSKENLERQKSMFALQIELALETNLPLVIHTREATDETLAMLDQLRDVRLRGVIHCYSANSTYAREFIQRNFLLGIGGAVTYPKNDFLRDVVRQMPLESLVLETDAPFLPPQWMRGKQNRPALVAEIAAYCAQLRGCPVEDIERITTKNAKKLFAILG